MIGIIAGAGLNIQYGRAAVCGVVARYDGCRIAGGKSCRSRVAPVRNELHGSGFAGVQFTGEVRRDRDDQHGVAGVDQLGDLPCTLQGGDPVINTRAVKMSQQLR